MTAWIETINGELGNDPTIAMPKMMLVANTLKTLANGNVNLLKEVQSYFKAQTKDKLCK